MQNIRIPHEMPPVIFSVINAEFVTTSFQMLSQWPGRLAGDLGPRKLHQSLTHRGLVRLSGDDSIPFLNGLVTNDMHQFDASRGHSVIYTLLLNSLVSQRNMILNVSILVTFQSLFFA